MIEGIILDNQEEGIPKERVMEKLKKRFSITEEEAQEYIDKYWK